MKDEVYRELVEDKYGGLYLFQVIHSEEKYYEVFVNKVEINGEDISLLDDKVSYCLMEVKDEESIEFLFHNYKAYRGLGLGSKLVDFAKRYAYSQGFKKAILNRIKRYVPHPLAEYAGEEDLAGIKDLMIDGNLVLYLNHNFREKVSPEGYAYKYNMICDLEAKAKMSSEEYELSILNNRTEAYLEKGKE